MTSYVLNCPSLSHGTQSEKSAAQLPDPATIPPEQTNT
jgi:hypothetical protein